MCFKEHDLSYRVIDTEQLRSVCVRWNLRVVLICISLITKDPDHFLEASEPLDFPQLRIPCLALYPILNFAVMRSHMSILVLSA